MKIKETVHRECCQEKDLLTYGGLTAKWVKPVHSLLFCKYCGQVWFSSKEMGPAGSYEPCLKKLVAGSDKDA